jgi:hypothetical protein
MKGCHLILAGAGNSADIIRTVHYMAARGSSRLREQKKAPSLMPHRDSRQRDCA